MNKKVAVLVTVSALLMFVGTAAASGDASSTSFDVVTFLENAISFFESLLEMATSGASGFE